MPSLTAGAAALAAPAAPAALAARAACRMNLQADFTARMQKAMKGGADAKPELAAVRLVVAAMTTKAKEGGDAELSDEQSIAVLAKLAKMRKESIEMFEKGGKDEAAAKEKFELAILEEYLPSMADEATVRAWVDEAVAAACPDGPDKSKMGMVMGKLMKAHKGDFDGKLGQRLVGEALSGK